MSLKKRFKIFYAWWPIAEVKRCETGGGFDFTGRYYWRQKVNAVNNDYHGWIAFDDMQTQEHLERCPSCNHVLDTGRLG